MKMGRQAYRIYPVSRPVTRSQTRQGIKQLLPMLSCSSRAKPRKRTAVEPVDEVTQVLTDVNGRTLMTSASSNVSKCNQVNLQGTKRDAGDIMNILQEKQVGGINGMPILTAEVNSFTKAIEINENEEMEIQLLSEVYDYAEVLQMQQEGASFIRVPQLDPEVNNFSEILQLPQEEVCYTEMPQLSSEPTDTSEIPQINQELEETVDTDQLISVPPLPAHQFPDPMVPETNIKEGNNAGMLAMKQDECNTIGMMEINQQQTDYGGNPLENFAFSLPSFLDPVYSAENSERLLSVEEMLQSQESFFTALEQNDDLDKILMPPPPVPVAGSSKNLKSTIFNLHTESNQLPEGTNSLEFVSDDTRLHGSDCPYTNWAVHRACLTSNADIQAELLNYFMLEKSCNFTEAKQKIAKAMSKDSPIMKHVQSTRDMLDSFKDSELQECTCITARLIAKSPETLKLLKMKSKVVIYGN